MLRDITTIKFSGANFISETAFDFFKPQKKSDSERQVKGVLLYGRNGSGKSTLAKAFKKIADKSKEEKVINSVEVYDADGNQVVLSDDEKKRVFVFDEKYVDDNVKLKSDCLDTIVMLGEDADLDDKIKDAEKERDNAKQDFEIHKTSFDEYNDAKNVKSPEYYKNKINEILKAEGGWAARDRDIHDKNNKSQVRSDKYLDFVNVTPIKKRDELVIDYNAKMKELSDAKSGITAIKYPAPSISEIYLNFDDDAIQALLAKKIEKPEFSEREIKLFEIIQNGCIDTLSEKLEFFRNDKNTECPYCYKPLEPEYKRMLVDDIKHVLKDEIKEHEKELKKHILEEIDIKLNDFEKLGSYSICNDLIVNLNSIIQKNNINIQNKLENLYEPVVTDVPAIKSIAVELKEKLEQLEQERIDYNTKAKDPIPIISKLDDINNELTHYDIIDDVNQLNTQKAEFEKETKKHNDLQRILNEKEQVIKDLEGEKGKVKLAVDAINDCIKYVFFAENRLKIVYDDKAYKLLSNGHNVKPCDVSAGERNIIGLSYFFISIFRDQEEKSAYNNDYLLVIDDPISSYDAENRIGILSFLKYKLGQFMEGNKNTKALVMTHDLMTYYDMNKIFAEIKKTCNSHKKQHEKDAIINCFELRDECLIIPEDHYQEYSELLKRIYLYATYKSKEEDFLIGNIMRQALEAFATFEYKKGIIDVTTDSKILKMLPTPQDKYAEYFSNLMYRLVLNGESHKEEAVGSMKDLRFFDLISEKEKRKTAKDIICFMYLLNKNHIIMQLKGCSNVENNIKQWLKSIKR